MRVLVLGLLLAVGALVATALPSPVSAVPIGSPINISNGNNKFDDEDTDTADQGMTEVEVTEDQVRKKEVAADQDIKEEVTADQDIKEEVTADQDIKEEVTADQDIKEENTEDPDVNGDVDDLFNDYDYEYLENWLDELTNAIEMYEFEEVEPPSKHHIVQTSLVPPDNGIMRHKEEMEIEDDFTISIKKSASHKELMKAMKKMTELIHKTVKPCPDKFFYYKERCFRISTFRATKDQATGMCYSLGSRLASVPDSTFLMRLAWEIEELPQVQESRDAVFWTGAKQVKGKWFWENTKKLVDFRKEHGRHKRQAGNPSLINYQGGQTDKDRSPLALLLQRTAATKSGFQMAIKMQGDMKNFFICERPACNSTKDSKGEESHPTRPNHRPRDPTTERNPHHRENDHQQEKRENDHMHPPQAEKGHPTNGKPHQEVDGTSPLTEGHGQHSGKHDESSASEGASHQDGSHHGHGSSSHPSADDHDGHTEETEHTPSENRSEEPAKGDHLKEDVPPLKGPPEILVDPIEREELEDANFLDGVMDGHLGHEPHDSGQSESEPVPEK